MKIQIKNLNNGYVAWISEDRWAKAEAAQTQTEMGEVRTIGRPTPSGCAMDDPWREVTE